MTTRSINLGNGIHNQDKNRNKATHLSVNQGTSSTMMKIFKAQQFGLQVIKELNIKVSKILDSKNSQ